MILLPDKYDELGLNRHEKFLINMMKNKYSDSNIVLLKINPVGESTVNIFIFQEGVCFLETIDLDDENVLKVIIPQIILLKKKIVDKIYNKLLMHKYFNCQFKEHNILLFPFTYKYYFPSLNKNQLENFDFDINIKDFLINNCINKDTVSSSLKNPESFKQILMNNYEYPYSIKWTKFTQEGVDILIHMLAPEYTIPRYGDLNIQHNNISKKADNEYNIQQGELSVKVLKLDNDQINITNHIKPGNQLILACAGSGKSVLLISKCFKIASLNPDKQFLITCFNKNLCNMYEWRINVAGFRNRNVKCTTFFKLCENLLDEARVYYNSNNFDSVFEQAKKALSEGKIKKRFYGIFIDEVQIFKSEWYEFCYNLLENKNEEDHFFVICGDKSQNINKNIKQGKAPWQGNPNLPNYRGKSLRIEKNYRNSIEINEFMNKFTESAKGYFSYFNIDAEQNNDLFLRGQSVRHGENPKVILSNEQEEPKEIIKIIEDLNKQKGVPLSEIAILVFNKQYQPEKYFIYNWIKDKLDDEYIDYSELVSYNGSYGVLYGDRTGISLCTIESALGLDFEAVIVCGLHSMGSYFKTKKAMTFNSKNPELDECKRDFFQNINTIYTGCTRARNHLYIILTEDKEKSLYSKIILESI